jgi:hypothetical protein
LCEFAEKREDDLFREGGGFFAAEAKRSLRVAEFRMDGVHGEEWKVPSGR